jgi:hypothetical protein
MSIRSRAVAQVGWLLVFIVGGHVSRAQTAPVVGSLTITRGQGASLTIVAPSAATRVVYWSDPGAGLPAGVTLTATFTEPASPQLTLHFEAIGSAPLATNRLVGIRSSIASIAFKVSLNVVASGGGNPCAVPTVQPLDQSTQAVLVSNVTPGCKVEAWAGGGNGSAPVAQTTAAPGATVARLPLRGRLAPGQIVRALQAPATGTTTTFLGGTRFVEHNYVTSRYDNLRSGWNPGETALTTRTARNLAKVCEHPVDAPIRGQPLYVQDVEIPGKGRHNVVFTATDADSVYAFDADKCTTDKGLWVDAAGNSAPRSLIDAANGERAAAASDLTSRWPPGSVPDCAIMLGITATPVVDRTTNTLYVLGLLIKNNQPIYRLHALDITTGHEQPGSPTVIDGSTVQFRGVSFEPALQGDRAGLLLDRGVLYLGFGSHCDIGAYHGWVVAYDAKLPGTSNFLQQVGVFNTSPTSPGSGVWQAGLGLAADGDGTIHLITGNGPFDATVGNYGNTVLELSLPTSPASKEMAVTQFFTPYDWDSAYNPGDADFGSGGVVLLPPVPPGALTTGPFSHRLMLAGGKVPKGYLIDRDCVGCSGNPDRCKATTGHGCTADDPSMVLQTVAQPNGIVAGPAYYNGPHGTRVFYGYNYSPLAAYDLQGFPSTLTFSEAASDAAPLTSPIVTVSSNGAAPGAGVLWSIFFPGSSATGQALRLYAYDAENLQDNLFSLKPQRSLEVGSWAGSTYLHAENSFSVPTVMNGRVYAGTSDRLVVFAPLFPCAPIIDCNRGVALVCRRGDYDLVLERAEGKRWRTVTEPPSRTVGNSVFLFDYAPGGRERYRVCLRNEPQSCTAELDLTVSSKKCQPPAGRKCGVRGEPPCFLQEPWPQSAGHRRHGPEPHGREPRRPATRE